MIHIHIEMHPFGDETRKYTLAKGFIINNGEGSQEIGHYNAYFNQTIEQGKTYQGKVENFTRKNGVLRLIHQALSNIFRESA